MDPKPIVIRNTQIDLIRIKEVEQILLELARFNADMYVIPEAISAAKYWVEVAQELLQHEFIKDQDVFLAHKTARGKIVNY